MGNNIPCCDSGSNDQKLLEKAVARQTQLNHDIRLARHNKLVNSSTLTSMLSGSPASNSDGISIVEGTLPKKRKSPKNKNQSRRSSLQKKKGPVRSILKPSSNYKLSPNTTPIQTGPKILTQVSAQHLKLRLHKLQAHNDQNLVDLPTDKLALDPAKKTQPVQGTGSETDHSTPSTVEERVNGAKEGREYGITDLKSEVRMEDLFNSDDDSEEEPTGVNKESFAELAHKASMRGRQHSEKHTIPVGSKVDLVNVMYKRGKIMTKQVKEEAARPFAAGFTNDDIARRTSQRQHKRSNTDYMGLLSSIQASTNGKATVLKVNNAAEQELDASLLGDYCNQSNLSDHLYERKRLRRAGRGMAPNTIVMQKLR